MTGIPFRTEPTAPGVGPFAYELPQGGRVRITVRAGDRSTGGHAIAVTRITRTGPQLVVECAISAPAPGAIVTQVLTAPAHTVSVDESAVRGVRGARLVDQAGSELARISA